MTLKTIMWCHDIKNNYDWKKWFLRQTTKENLKVIFTGLIIAKYWHGRMHLSVLFVVAKLDFAESIKKHINLLLL